MPTSDCLSENAAANVSTQHNTTTTTDRRKAGTLILPFCRPSIRHVDSHARTVLERFTRVTSPVLLEEFFFEFLLFYRRRQAELRSSDQNGFVSCILLIGAVRATHVCMRGTTARTGQTDPVPHERHSLSGGGGALRPPTTTTNVAVNIAGVPLPRYLCVGMLERSIVKGRTF